MGEHYPARSFKSGNSIAIRMPAELGIEPGEEFQVVKHDDGSLTATPVSRLKEGFLALAGSMSPGWMADGRPDSEQAGRDWSSGQRPDAR